MMFNRALLLLCVSVLVVSIVSDSPWPPAEFYVDQPLDHFRFPQNGPTFPQRLLLFTDYFSPFEDGPVIFYTGNEATIEDFWNNTGFAFELGKSLNALVVFAEHRYYGKSLPFGNNSFTPVNLQYLTVEQVLSDYAVDITVLQKKFSSLGPVIAIGGSYGGVLAAYMRFKYPNLVLGALASSAPIYWNANIGSRGNFYEDVTKDFNDVSSQCVDIIRQAFNNITKIAATGPLGLGLLSSEFSTCQPLYNMKDVAQLNIWLRAAFATFALYDYPYAATFGGNLPAWPVNETCKTLLLYGQIDPLFAIRMVVSSVYNTTKGQSCFDIYQEYSPCSDVISGCCCDNDATAWDYQACTEMNRYDDHVPDPNKEMFPYLPFDATTRNKYCQDKFNVTPSIDHMKTHYWGDNIMAASNILFTNGDLDPWRRGGVLTNLTDSLTAFVIHGGAHHLDIRESNVNDTASVKECRQYIFKTVNTWLGF